jgi:hypothetical protein
VVAQVCHLTGKRAGAACSHVAGSSCLSCCNESAPSCRESSSLSQSCSPLPPPAYGSFGEFDSGSLFIDGGGEGSSPVCSVLQFGSGNTFSLSALMMAGDCRLASKAMLWPYLKSVKDSCDCITSQLRPLSKSATALIAFSEASGFVPTSRLDGGSFDLHLRLDGGEREGPNCIASYLSGVLSAFTRDLCFICFSYGVLYNNLYTHRLLIM